MFNSYHIKRIKKSMCNKKMTSIMITNQCIKSVTNLYSLLWCFPSKLLLYHQYPLLPPYFKFVNGPIPTGENPYSAILYLSQSKNRFFL